MNFGRQSGLCRAGCQAQDFATGAFGHDFERTAADLAVGRKALTGEAGIHRQAKRLAAKRALDVREFFHAGKLTATGQNATAGHSHGKHHGGIS